jgi:inner membrane protein YidH
MSEQISQGAPALDTATQLSFERTRNSYENTMMSWIRTATSLITFGFSIYKFFQIETPRLPQPNRVIGPREFALMLVSIGIFSLLLATLEHRASIRALGPLYTAKRRSLALLVAAMVSMLGVLALLAMIFRQ